MARALVNRPGIVLADEPTGNLDSQTARQVMDLILNHVREHAATLILVTHDEELAASCTTGSSGWSMVGSRPWDTNAEWMEDRLVRWIDLLRLPLASLGQQKVRTCLTTLGVALRRVRTRREPVDRRRCPADDRTRDEQGRRRAEGHGLSEATGGRDQGGGRREGRRADGPGSA